MKVKQLIELLKDIPEDCLVQIGHGEDEARTTPTRVRYMSSADWEGFPSIVAIDDERGF